MNIGDIKKLADLARIDMNQEEMESMAKDFDPILAYVGQVQEALKSIGDTVNEKEEPLLFNVMRDDIATNNQGEFTVRILAEMPETEEGYLKVKQIL